ncbi:hypothetical protein [Occallatibacter riparius]|uniref:Uncharacterized protein n=1 Tax=Occallatibacter riparius TaxID=1002689 RepID=A0A9J7BTM0_9BACT|nr:hypothetical protein [Occallatibacter riparius]UWZ84341.1 hypothetical protein MOP44_00050 [Occallatibacter riparius]
MAEPYVRLLTLLLEGAEIANFEYWAEFIIRLQRDESTTRSALREWFGERRIPPLFCVRLRGRWWIGSEEEWSTSLKQFPFKGVPPIPLEAPLQASTLMTMLGLGISSLRVNESGGLTLILSDGRVVNIQGTNPEWAESWFLELPIDDVDRDQWSLICDSEGHITGTYPQSAIS